MVLLIALWKPCSTPIKCGIDNLQIAENNIIDSELHIWILKNSVQWSV